MVRSQQRAPRCSSHTGFADFAVFQSVVSIFRNAWGRAFKPQKPAKWRLLILTGFGLITHTTPYPQPNYSGTEQEAISGHSAGVLVVGSMVGNCLLRRRRSKQPAAEYSTRPPNKSPPTQTRRELGRAPARMRVGACCPSMGLLVPNPRFSPPGLPRDQLSGPWLFSTAEARTRNHHHHHKPGGFGDLFPAFFVLSLLCLEFPLPCAPLPSLASCFFTKPRTEPRDDVEPTAGGARVFWTLFFFTPCLQSRAPERSQASRIPNSTSSGAVATQSSSSSNSPSPSPTPEPAPPEPAPPEPAPPEPAPELVELPSLELR